MSDNITIYRAAIDDLEQLAMLFDAYRVFYEQASDVAAASQFLQSHLEQNSSVIFIAKKDTEYLGFTQLYKSYSSVSMNTLWILNDLYVSKHTRGQGIGEALLNQAKAFAKENGAKGVGLETGKDNPAQKLYERLGWKKDLDYLHYFWKAK